MKTVTEAIRERLDGLDMQAALLDARREGLAEALQLAEAVVSGNAVDEVPPPRAKALRMKTPKSLPPAKPKAKKTKAAKPKGSAGAKLSDMAEAVMHVFRADPENSFTAIQVLRKVGEKRGKNVPAVRMTMTRLAQKGLLTRVDKGLWRLAEESAQ